MTTNEGQQTTKTTGTILEIQFPRDGEQSVSCVLTLDETKDGRPTCEREIHSYSAHDAVAAAAFQAMGLSEGDRVTIEYATHNNVLLAVRRVLILSLTFSPRMLRKNVTLSFTEIEEALVARLLAGGFTSIVPYQETAELLSQRLGVPVLPNSAKIVVAPEEVMIVALPSEGVELAKMGGLGVGVTYWLIQPGGTTDSQQMGMAGAQA